MITFYPAPPSAPTFTYSSRRGNFVSVHKGEFLPFLRADPCRGFFSELISGTQFLQGAATFAFHCGVPGELIQSFGDWASDAYNTYLKFRCQLRFKSPSR